MPKPFSLCTVRNKNFLKSISKAFKKKRNLDIKKYIENASCDQLNSITEIIRNTLKGNIPFSPNQKRILQKHRDKIRDLGKLSLPTGKRRKLLQQTGGFLPTLITPVLVAIASELAHKYL